MDEIDSFAHLARELVADLLRQAVEIANAHGIKVTTRGARFDDGSCVVRIEFYRTMDAGCDDSERLARARRRWLDEHRAFELGASTIDNEFPFDGERLVVLGLEVVGETRFVLARHTGESSRLRLLPTSVVALAFATRSHIEVLARQQEVEREDSHA